MKKDIQVAHSPEFDDAFMFYALATRKIDTGDLNYVTCSTTSNPEPQSP